MYSSRQKAALAVVLIAAVTATFLWWRSRSRPVSSPYAEAWFTYPEEVDPGPFTDVKVLLDGQNMIGNTVTVVSGSKVPLNVDASFQDPPPVTLTHQFCIAHRPATDRSPDFSQVYPGQEWHYYLRKDGTKPDEPLTIKIPPGDYKVRVYVRIEDDTTAIRQLRVHYLGEGNVKVVAAPAAES